MEKRTVEPASVQWASLGPGIQIMHAADSQERWRVFHENYCFAVVHGGAGRWQYRRRHQAITPGALMLSEPGEVHLTTGVDSPATFTSVFMSGEYFHSRFEGDLRGTAHFTAAQIEACAGWMNLAGRLARRTLDATEAVGREEQGDRLVDELLLGVGSLLARAGQEKPRAAPRCPARLQRAHEAIVENYRSNPATRLDIDELAKTLGVSRFWLTHSFKQQFGYSPSELHTLQRAARARSLLSTGGSELATATAAAGYCDQPQLTREFRRHWRTTPGRYQSALGV